MARKWMWLAGMGVLALPGMLQAQEPRDRFWDRLSALCERAAEGTLLQAPDEQIRPEQRLVVHFWECGADEIRFPLHVDDNRSRTWVLLRHADHLELRHDHRKEDGSEDTNTWYGATTLEPGTAARQEFVTRRPDGSSGGWAIEIEPGVRFTYGTIRNGEWRHHLEFDLREPIAPPPMHWGHEIRPSQLPEPHGGHGAHAGGAAGGTHDHEPAPDPHAGHDAHAGHVTQPAQPAQPVHEAQHHHGHDMAGLEATAGAGYTVDDVMFMQMMLGHHAQAVTMAHMVPRRSTHAGLERLALKIRVSQDDEMGLMMRWLRARGQAIPTPEQMAAMQMPGLVSAEELARLETLEGAAFDKRFLELMIEHHLGAVAMVDDLFASPGSMQDSELFQFASDVGSDQRDEIGVMEMLLERLVTSARSNHP